MTIQEYIEFKKETERKLTKGISVTLREFEEKVGLPIDSVSFNRIGHKLVDGSEWDFKYEVEINVRL